MTRSAGILLAFAAAIAQTPQTADSDVIRINVNLVQVDAVVIDSKDHPVANLKAGDFEILQDGKRQSITNFSYITTRAADGAVAVARAAPPKPQVKGAAAPPPVPLKPTQARRTIALVVDDLGLAFDSVARVRQSLKKFVDQEMEPGDLVAIIRTGAGMGALQQFTGDKQMLYAAIERVKFNSMGRVGVSSFRPLGSARDPIAVAEGREEIFSVGTLGAIRYVVDGLKELPGRKALVLFSENMRLFYKDGMNPLVMDNMRRLTDAANRASVVIYSIDPRGLQTYSLTAEDNTGKMTARQISRVPMQRSREAFNSQDGLVLLAHDTGGLFLDNTNDISGALRKAIDDSEGYYLIGYHPDSSTFDPKTGEPKFHKVEVRVKVAGLHVRTRSGFFGHSDALHTAAPRGREAELARALSSPFGANGIHVRLTTMFSDAPAAGSILTSMLYIDAKDLKFSQEADGTHKAVIDVEEVTFGDAGQAVDSISRTYTMTVKEAAYQQALKVGLIYSLHDPVKKPGAYQVRVALRDAATEQVGSASQFIEVPDVSKGRLTLSSVVVRRYVPEKPGEPAAQTPPVQGDSAGTPAVRTFKPGEEVLYGYQILNAQTDQGKTRIETQTRVFRDGEEIFTGKPTAIDPSNQPDMKRLANGGVLRLGAQMKPGDYVLQVVVTDKVANRTGSQWVDFEVE